MRDEPANEGNVRLNERLGAFETIKGALEEHYCSHPEFYRGPNGAEICKPLDDALDSLELIRATLADLVNQVRKSDPVDQDGHELVWNRAYLEAVKLLDA